MSGFVSMYFFKMNELFKTQGGTFPSEATKDDLYRFMGSRRG